MGGQVKATWVAGLLVLLLIAVLFVPTVLESFESVRPALEGK